MKQKEYDEWIERLGEIGTLHTENLATIREFEELLHVFHPGLVDKWNAMNHWEKLRLIEFIVNASAKMMIAH